MFTQPTMHTWPRAIPYLHKAIVFDRFWQFFVQSKLINQCRCFIQTIQLKITSSQHPAFFNQPESALRLGPQGQVWGGCSVQNLWPSFQALCLTPLISSTVYQHEFNQFRRLITFLCWPREGSSEQSQCAFRCAINKQPTCQSKQHE